MSEKFSWSLKVLLASGPPIEVSDDFDAEATDNISFEIDSATADPATTTPTPVDVDIQPSVAVKFLAITSSVYDAGLTYKVDGGTTNITLDQPHLFIDQKHLFLGKDVSGVLNKAPKKMTFSNAIWDKVNAKGQKVTIEIRVGRDAKG